MLDQRDFIDRFRDITKGIEGALVCFTGGVDSALLLLASAHVLKENVVAVTFVSPLQAKKNLNLASNIAEKLSVPHIVCKYNPLSYPEIRFNKKDRCYICKSRMFFLSWQIARKRNINTIFEGAHIEDSEKTRPGMKALREFNIKSPLKELGLSKANIRALAKKMGLISWNFPSESCLATRFPIDHKLRKLDLEKLEQAETILSEYGLKRFRIRPYDNPPTILVSQDEMPIVKAIGEAKLFSEINKIGYFNISHLIYSKFFSF